MLSFKQLDIEYYVGVPHFCASTSHSKLMTSFFLVLYSEEYILNEYSLSLHSEHWKQRRNFLFVIGVDGGASEIETLSGLAQDWIAGSPCFRRSAGVYFEWPLVPERSR